MTFEDPVTNELVHADPDELLVQRMAVLNVSEHVVRTYLRERNELLATNNNNFDVTMMTQLDQTLALQVFHVETSVLNELGLLDN